MASRAVLLDAGPLGLVTNPKRSPRSLACANGFSHSSPEESIAIPEIADYEVRRELLRANKTKGLAQLDAFANLLEYLPLTTSAMHQAALFWA